MKKSTLLAELPTRVGLRQEGESWWAAVARYLEENGIPFDPEEESLPAPLFYINSADPWISTADEYSTGLAVAGIPARWAPNDARLPILRELVRRYNAWPALLTIAERLGNAAEGDREDLSMIQEDLDRVLGVITNAGVRGAFAPSLTGGLRS